MSLAIHPTSGNPARFHRQRRQHGVINTAQLDAKQPESPAAVPSGTPVGKRQRGRERCKPAARPFGQHSVCLRLQRSQSA